MQNMDRAEKNKALRVALSMFKSNYGCIGRAAFLGHNINCK